MHNCEYITAAHGSPEGVVVDERCDQPASLKRQGMWLCVEHYDQIEGAVIVNWADLSVN